MYLINRLRALVRDDRGQDLIEYALLAALIALASVLAIQAAGTQVNNVWNAIVGGALPLIMAIALTGLEFLVGAVQAYVFAVLTCMYLNDAIHPSH